MSLTISAMDPTEGNKGTPSAIALVRKKCSFVFGQLKLAKNMPCSNHTNASYTNEHFVSLCTVSFQSIYFGTSYALTM